MFKLIAVLLSLSSATTGDLNLPVSTKSSFREVSSVQSKRHAPVEDSVQDVIDGHPELLGNSEYDYEEFVWKLNMTPERKKAPYSALTQDEAVSIMAYTSELYQEINRRLRLGEPLDEFKVLVDSINSGLKRLPDYRGIVYRSSADLSAKLEAEHREGCVVDYPAFTSSSLSGFHEQFGTKHFLISSMHGKDISPISIHYQRDSEREVLFASGTHFQVLKPDLFEGRPAVFLKETAEVADTIICRQKKAQVENPPGH